DVIGGEAHQEVWIDEFAFVANPFVIVETGERRASARSAGGEGPGAVAMRDAAFPIELTSAAMLERRHDAAQFRMYPRTVVTFVVIFEQHFPVCGDLVTQRSCRAKLRERIARNALCDR